jgi:glycosyltransferase involved in cell wall biosynthesis
MKRLLLVSHRPLDVGGGGSARWRSLTRHLPDFGWSVDVVSAPALPGEGEYSADPRERRAVERRARTMARVGRLADPVFSLAGVRPDAMPLSMLWVRPGRAAVRAALEAHAPDVVLATGPPMAGVLAARAALAPDAPPFVVELRDLWAGSPAFDRGGRILPALERWVFEAASAVVACTPEAVADLAARHAPLRGRLHEVPNGFEPSLLERRSAAGPAARERLTILHSGTLSVDRPLAPLLRVLAREPYRSRVRLVLHGLVVPAIADEIVAAPDGVDVAVVPPSSWEDAVERIAACDVALITQAAGAGDATAVASKVYEYLALGRPVLCVSDGGATEAVLRRLGADALCARLGDDDSIAAALDRALAGPLPAPPAPERLARYDRRALARSMAALLDEAAQGG